MLAALATLSGTVVAMPTETRSAELATAWHQIPNGRLRLVAGSGDRTTLLAGIEIALAPGWKTYWRTPGDTGVPPNIDLTRSINLASARVLYPAPKRYREPGGETIGYKEAVTFPIRITAEDGSAPIALALALEIGVCEQICIPVEATLALTIPPADDVAPLPAAIRDALATVPRAQSALREGDPRLVAADGILTGPNPKLVISMVVPDGSEGADAFVEAPDGLWLPQPRVVGREGNMLHMEVDLSDGVELAALAGKPLHITLVSSGGASEASWTPPGR